MKHRCHLIVLLSITATFILAATSSNPAPTLPSLPSLSLPKSSPVATPSTPTLPSLPSLSLPKKSTATASPSTTSLSNKTKSSSSLHDSDSTKKAHTSSPALPALPSLSLPKKSTATAPPKTSLSDETKSSKKSSSSLHNSDSTKKAHTSSSTSTSLPSLSLPKKTTPSKAKKKKETSTPTKTQDKKTTSPTKATSTNSTNSQETVLPIIHIRNNATQEGTLKKITLQISNSKTNKKSIVVGVVEIKIPAKKLEDKNGPIIAFNPTLNNTSFSPEFNGIKSIEVDGDTIDLPSLFTGLNAMDAIAITHQNGSWVLDSPAKKA